MSQSYFWKTLSYVWHHSIIFHKSNTRTTYFKEFINSDDVQTLDLSSSMTVYGFAKDLQCPAIFTLTADI